MRFGLFSRRRGRRGSSLLTWRLLLLFGLEEGCEGILGLGRRGFTRVFLGLGLGFAFGKVLVKRPVGLDPILRFGGCRLTRLSLCGLLGRGAG